MASGRPSKLTQEVTDRILVALRSGNFRKVAAWYAGISPRTLREWMAAGKESPDSEFGVLRRQVIEAEQAAEMRMVALVMKAASNDAKHAEWWLERKANKRWGRKERHEVTGKNGSPLMELTDEQLEARYRALLAKGAGAAAEPKTEPQE